MKILFLSFYFSPDLSAGSFRSTILVDTLLKQTPQNTQIDIVTTLPNRYKNFKVKASELEIMPKVTIKRIKITNHNSGMIDQAKAFTVFAKNALKYIRGKNYDLIYATSGRLMTAFLGATISKKLKKPLYLDIRDIFSDTIQYILPKYSKFMIVPLINYIEDFTLNTAKKVNLVSLGFLPYFKNKYPHIDYTIFTNGIDQEFTLNQFSQGFDFVSSPYRVIYAGNIGEGQGLHNIIPKLAKKFEGKLIFKLIGDGSRRKALEFEINKYKCSNVEIHAPVNRADLFRIYTSADILFLHLNDFPAFKKVLPSKLFEYGATGKPIWAGLSGYPAEFVNQNIENAAIFDPGDIKGAELSFTNLKIQTVNRAKFVKKFNRKKIMDKMARDIVNIIEN